ncbi:LacI family DNA-binding transcriptional regulator [Actinoplanes sp. NPDC051851]|uniref:LacI family DNA-binding transcriptional regulator n=1 Tax=Actinoplanes sp. NPDC051851 TaxID=3154753 RepID=UPI0034476728
MTVTRAPVMTDVARLAGVSHQTVSRVLNNHPNVKTITRQRVLDAIRMLGYRPNAHARGLAGRHARVIGVISYNTILYGPAATLLGIERAARAAGYGVSIATLERIDPQGITSAIGALTDQSVAGIIVVAPQHAAATALHGLPEHIPAVTVGPSGISVAQTVGARLITEHLLNLGHPTVWHIAGPPDSVEARDRIDSWTRAMNRAGVTPPAPITGDWSARSGYLAGLALASRRGVTAVFAGNDHMALGLLRAFAERGVRVPGDISVAGFDDIPEAAYLNPPLTTVRQDFDEVGRRCIATLLHRLGAGGPVPDAVTSVAPTLVVRDSTAPH